MIVVRFLLYVVLVCAALLVCAHFLLMFDTRFRGWISRKRRVRVLNRSKVEKKKPPRSGSGRSDAA